MALRASQCRCSVRVNVREPKRKHNMSSKCDTRLNSRLTITVAFVEVKPIGRYCAVSSRCGHDDHDCLG
ncbi:hypothetical protein SCHPADRAFT_637405 [Schizopora paradoxa]|uniref:Uncharacterized protein n=1 Tax=Schizopora paradoxa TaxID=27342 RepID=A0A0H2R769_9AGAM|nr:hypothetical protein SCHPADRAFT_637405 [Schizopora paradoxa]